MKRIARDERGRLQRLEWLADPVGGEAFAAVIADTDSLIVPTLCLFEVHRVVTRQFDRERADAVVEAMQGALVVDLTAPIALLASDLAKQYGLATADAIIYATAESFHATLWTQDAHFKDLPNVRYVAKQTSRPNG